ncbi:MAG: methyltransferase domain-containing protein [Dehalococcoidia bacterium]
MSARQDTTPPEGGPNPDVDPWMDGRKRLIIQAITGITTQPSEIVLDVAAGDGALSALVAAQVGGRLVTHDWDGRECAASHAAGRETVRGDVRRLPFASGSAAVTIAFEIIEHFKPEDARTIVDELYRVTRPGGALLLSTPNRGSLESWKELLRFVLRGAVWNARDQTHVTIYTRRELDHLLGRRFTIRRWLGYSLVPKFLRRDTPWTYSIASHSAVAGLGFLILAIAER